MTQITGLQVFGISNPDSPSFKNKTGVIVFDLKGNIAVKVAERLAEIHGIGVRYGCHCAHIIIKHLLKVPPLLERFQHILLFLFPGLSLPGVTRISLGIENRKEDIDRLVSGLENLTLKPGDKKSQTRSSYKQQLNEFILEVSGKVYGTGAN
jgi:selenocysteine lyase/cysteine desulfurase